MYDVPKDMLVTEKKNAFKVDLAAPFLNHITVGYERWLKTGLNLEVKAGLIGPGFSHSLDTSDGFLLKAGVKFVICGTSYMRGQKYTNPMKGNFLKPELMYSRFNTKSDSKKTEYTNFAVNLILGKQLLVGERFSFEFFGGLGFGFQSSDYVADSQYDKSEKDFNYAYSHIYFGKELPIVISGGFTAGFIF